MGSVVVMFKSKYGSCYTLYRIFGVNVHFRIVDSESASSLCDAAVRCGPLSLADISTVMATFISELASVSCPVSHVKS